MTWILVGILVWSLGAGYTAGMLRSKAAWSESGESWLCFVFLWIFLLPGAYGWLAAKKLAARSEDPIRISKGAKVVGWEKYKELSNLCTEFELANGIDNRSLFGKN